VRDRRPSVPHPAAIRRLRATCLALTGAMIAACGSDSSGPDNGEPVATVTVAPAIVPLGVGQSQPLTATLQDAAGNTLTGRTVAWSTNAGSVATVDASSGLVTAVAVGSATITAMSEGQSGVAQVTVSAGSGFPQGLTPTGTILGDWRTSLQNATTKAQACALFVPQGGQKDCVAFKDEPADPYGISLVTNFDGTGRHALQFKMSGPHCSTDGGAGNVAVLGSNFTGGATHFFFQFRYRFGKHPLDATGVGADNAWKTGWNACDPLNGMKVIYLDFNSYRLDIHWMNDGLRYELVGQGGQAGLGSWSTLGVAGQEHVLTVEYTLTANGGIRWYVDGVLTASVNRDLSMVGNPTRLRFHNVWSDPPFATTSYAWDFVAWAP